MNLNPNHCKSCFNLATAGKDTCFDCELHRAGLGLGPTPDIREKPPEQYRATDRSMADQYPKYYKKIPAGWKVIDVYGVHMLFNVADPSGALQHASKKILLSGVRTGGKSQFKDIMEARDALNRWMQLNPEPAKPLVDLTLQPKK